MAVTSTLPDVPVKHAEFLSYVTSHPDKPLPELLEPFKQYDHKLREVFAQEPGHPALADQHLNIVPVFNGHEKDIKIRARDLKSESPEETERYVMPLKTADRLADGSPAIVQDLKGFQQNFALFCESSLVDLDWSNVVAAGSSVVTCLLPVPDKYSQSKRSLRQYYHETIAPASDVDLFIYGLNEEDAIQKILDIEKRIKDSILTETTTIRTKNAITIASQYPTRHIQIVLRIYKSVAEILTGFDVDCSCAAYDGQQVYAAPRALTAYMTQTNTIDLTRRSPSYENRLSKYSHRGFEVYWPLLERPRIDPTIYERNFARTVGLARLLVLERLPSKTEREAYMDERRRERGRPPVNRGWNFSMGGNIKDYHEDEVAEWVEQDDVSDYHTFTIPYGPKYQAKKIEKLLYTKDLLLNAEWNKRDDREVNLHRHPAFFGNAQDVIHDCCGFCPKPVTPEEHDTAEDEAKIYVSGEISFIKDDPGRQAIGSFHPITDDDWTEMAYVGNTARLCQAIIDEDLEHVEDWLAQDGSDPNTRDYTGRTPLHLAVTSSSPAIVQKLIDHGSRLVARLADGRTALHLAASRGNAEMVKMILQKSEQNEEEEAKKEDIRKQARIAARKEGKEPIESEKAKKIKPETDSDDDIEMIDEDDSDVEMRSATTGSYVKVTEQQEKETKYESLAPEEDEDDPDVYDVNVLSWDTQTSPLHLAILGGHIDVVKELVQNFGADVLLPIKLLNDYDKSPRGAILTLVLSLNLPLEQAKAMTKTLLELGASSAQADTKQTTALHYISGTKPELLEVLFEHDEPAAKRAINHLAVSGSSYNPSAQSPLMSAICKGNALAALKLLEIGAHARIDSTEWIKTVEAQHGSLSYRDSKENYNSFVRDVDQPVLLAVNSELPDLARQLLDHGADPNTLTKGTHHGLIDDWYTRYHPMQSLLDVVQAKIQRLRDYKDDAPPEPPKYNIVDGTDYLEGIKPGTYKDFIARKQLAKARKSDKSTKKSYVERLKEYEERKGIKEKQQAIDSLASKFEKFEQHLLSVGAKTFKELHPDLYKDKDKDTRNSYQPRKPEPFGVEFSFDVHDLTDEMREGFLELFQAAWEGDLAAIKSLTLVSWGPGGDRIPLKITSEDHDAQTPFSIAVLRGHLDVARAIVEISFAQYHPETEQERAIYRMGKGRVDVEDSEDSEGESEDDVDDIPVYSEIVDNKFTVENIGEVSTQVKSRVSPLSFIRWATSAWDFLRYTKPDTKITYGTEDQEIKGDGALGLESWAITINDKDLFAFLLDLEVEWADRLADKSEDSSTSSTLPVFHDADFGLAIRYGRIDILAEMIKHAGTGMELASLVEKSGVQYREKPKFYQGLSVHGKKREDWVSAARGITHHGVTDSNPPLLRAAFTGNLSSVEWFSSATPSRHYLDFAEAYKHHKFINHLNTAGGGFEKVLTQWLHARNDLALHCAIMAPCGSESNRLIEHLIKVMPGSLETKSRAGHTPLALAFSLRRYDAIKILIEAGADQTVRDSDGRNIFHLLLCSAYTNACRSSKRLQKFLDLIDKRLVESLLSERCQGDPGSLTPLARWMRNSIEDAEVMRMVLDFATPSNNEHLELLDGSGETPLHNAVKSNNRSWLKTMLEYRPDLLYRENSVGRTPYEMAADAYISQRVSHAPHVLSTSSPNELVSQSAQDFDPNRESSDNSESVWTICEQAMKQNPGKRRLVSLLDANEVAKRLANRKREQHEQNKIYAHTRDAGSEIASEYGTVERYPDEVIQWYQSAHETVEY